MIQIEHGSFTPVVMSSMGGFGQETSRFISKLVEKTAEKNGKEPSHIRTKISYELIRSQVACIRGSRGLWKKPVIDTGECEVVDTVSRIRDC